MLPIAIIASSILTASALGLVGFIYYVTRQNYIPQRIPITKYPKDIGLDFTNVEIDIRGVTMRGWFIPVLHSAENGKGKPIIILFHGWASNAQYLLPYTKMIHDAGFQSLALNARGHGESDKIDHMSFLRYCEDVRSAIQYVESNFPSSPIALWGHSFGAGAVVVVGAEHPNIKAIAANAAFADFTHLAKTMLGWVKIPGFFSPVVTTIWEKSTGAKLEDWNPHAHALRAKNHLLAFHGGRDRIISPRHSQWLVENAKGRVDARCIILKKVNHFNFHDSPEYQKELIDFLNKYLK